MKAKEGMEIYELVAAEYYDSLKHPTCANFRTASSFIIEKFFNNTPHDKNILELGAGRSIIAEQLLSKGLTLNNLIISDLSIQMLSHSDGFETFGAKLRIIDALRMDIETNSINILIASLGDPYNTECFWMETARVLTNNGNCIFTTPSFEWASKFRPNEEIDTARFIVNGISVDFPSSILSIREQLQMIERQGLHVQEISHISLDDLKHGPISKKLDLGDPTLKIVTGYLISK